MPQLPRSVDSKVCSRLLSITCFAIFTTCCYSRDAIGAVPSYLVGYDEIYRDDPRAANLRWFTEAEYGLFIHYGLYSLLEDGEWIQFKHKPEPIPVSVYAKLAKRFTAEKFDADAITDLVLAAGMKYVTVTSKHHDGYALYDTKLSDFKSTNSPCGRDLIAELYEACDRKGVGLFLYYSYAVDWKHPWALKREDGWIGARPAYRDAQPEYHYRRDEDFAKYLEFADGQVRELLELYPNIAGVWFDPIMGYYARPELFNMEATYAMIREQSPHALISFKQGATGDEDFVAPERHMGGLVERVTKALGARSGAVAAAAWEKNHGKPREICDTMQPQAWGYRKSTDGRHLTAAQVLERLGAAKAAGANLLLNVGPRPDGSFPDEDISTLLEVGRALKANH